jgi:AraC family transcriptional regulator
LGSGDKKSHITRELLMKKSLRAFLVILILGIFLLIQAGCGKKTEKKPYEILTKTTEKMVFLYLEYNGPYDQVGPIFGQLGAYAAQKGLSGNMVGIYYDDPNCVRAESLRSELGIVVPEGTMPDSGYGVQVIPARKVVYAILKGPYEKIAEEYDYIMGWMTKNGYKMNGPVTEIYLEGGPDIPPEQYVTEVQFPVE